MTAVQRLLAAVILVLVLALGLIFWAHHYGAEQRAAGYAAAVAAGKEQHDRDTAAARKTESDLRAQLRGKDADAKRKEDEYATNLQNAQHRVRAGADSLRCPTAGPVQPSAAPDDRPAAGGSDPEAERPRIVPEVASDLLGVAADLARVVRQYDRITERFEECRALNAK
jgi:hypothetical protein